LYNLISGIPSYGNNRYTWAKGDDKGLLRYTACIQKLGFANEIDKNNSSLPIGIFEVSKSYRDEISETLQLCERVRSFYLPELHILNDSFDSALEVTMAAHSKIVENINTMYSDYIILCKMTYSFFTDHLDFINRLSDASGKPLVLWVLNKDEICNNGVEIDIEYKVTDVSGVQIEIATLQVDKGATDFALGVQYMNNQNEPTKVSTIHCVFFASIERAAFCLIDSSIKSLKTKGYNYLPFWAAPIQVRIVPENESCLKESKSFALELEQSGCRVDIDDRKIAYQEKLSCESWIPYLVKIQSEGSIFLLTENYNHDRTCEKAITRTKIIEEISKNIDRRMIIPRYTPMEMSKKF
jgi:threonyl-tRNA synthetase